MTPRILCQRNEKWSHVHIGASTLTIGGQGCLLTCVTMIGVSLGLNITPQTLADQNSLFTPDGYMIESKVDTLPQFEGKLKFLKIENGYNSSGILAAIKNPKQFVIIEVGNPAQTRTHFLWAWRPVYNFFGRIVDWLVADPYTGQEVKASLYLHSVGPIIGARYYFIP